MRRPPFAPPSGHRRRHHRPPWRQGRTLRGALLGSFIAAVVVTGLIVAGLFFFGGERDRFTHEVVRVAAHTAQRLNDVDDAVQARRIVTETSAAFATRLVVRERGLVVIEAGAGECRHPIVMPLAGPAGAERVLEACRPQPHGPPARALLGVGVVVGVLALLSGAVARRIAWPLRSLAETARQIGKGDLSARPRLGRHPFVEVRLVGEALAEMAGRIERELSGQRALLAGASHELRTPLGHLRILVETARDQEQAGRFDPKLLDEIDREISDLDSLLEKLLAQARLDFAHIDRREVDVVEVTRRALQRAGVDVGLLRGTAPLIQGDATLLARAIGNLLENAMSHGNGVAAVTVEHVENVVRVVVDDHGAGVDVADRERIFEPFVHRSDRGKGALGLGLHLVRRIAEAHGGRVVVEDRVDSAGDKAGGRFVLTLPG